MGNLCFFCSRDLELDLDIDPMTLKYEPNLKIPKIYLHTKMNFIIMFYYARMAARQNNRVEYTHTDTNA